MEVHGGSWWEFHGGCFVVVALGRRKGVLAWRKETRESHGGGSRW